MRQKNIDKLSIKDRNDFYNKNFDNTLTLILIYIISFGLSILNILTLIAFKMFDVKKIPISSLINMVCVLLFFGAGISIWYIIVSLKLNKKYNGKIK